MSISLPLPETGSWFRGPDGRTFEVVAVDEKDQTIELQHFDGTLEEMDAEAWLELAAEPVDAPEDWSGSLDMDSEDLPKDDMVHEAFDDPMNFVDSCE